MRILLFIAILSGGVFLAGCAVGPNYEKPKVSVEKSFAWSTARETTNQPVADWWNSFQDAELTKLINEALTNNYDLQIAVARIREARFQRNMAAADLFPKVDADAGYAHARGSKNVVLPLGGGSSSSGSGSSGNSGSSGSTGSGHAVPQSRLASESSSSSSGGGSGNSGGSVAQNAFDDQLNPIGEGGLPGAETDLYQVGFDATWEIDVFGGKRRQIEAAEAEVQAAREKQRDLTLSLIAEVARNYFELRDYQLRVAIARKNLHDQNETLELTRSLAQSGLTTQADVARAAAEAALTDATIPPLEAETQRSVHALSILMARDPNALENELALAQPLPPTPPEIPIGLPSQLIERRPDIRAAEREIAAANARIGSAEADLFPKFALVGNAGLDSSTANHLFDWDSRYFLISPTVTWRIFDAGEILSNIRLQKALTAEADLQFRSTLLKALQEVEDDLVMYATEQERYNQLNTAWKQNQLALELSRRRYERGLVSFLEVLDAERNVLSTQDQLAQASLSRITDLVALYKALGGGWN
jgi:NodT family efflux transporter outer membrane factor (OMF) lipoprotein